MSLQQRQPEAMPGPSPAQLCFISLGLPPSACFPRGILPTVCPKESANTDPCSGLLDAAASLGWGRVALPGHHGGPTGSMGMLQAPTMVLLQAGACSVPGPGSGCCSQDGAASASSPPGALAPRWHPAPITCNFLGSCQASLGHLCK